MRRFILISMIALTALVFSSCQSGKKVELVQKENQIDVMVEGQLLTSYLYGEDLLKPCLYPVNSLSGEVVTRAYPFEEIEGESSDHPHHTGLYFTYASNGEVNGDSYWNRHPVPPQIKQVEILEMEAERGEAEISALIHWINRHNKPILEEKREMEFTVAENEYHIDFDITLTAIDTVVTFEDTKEGMFAIRVADWLTEETKGTLYKSTGEYLNAEGDTKEEGVWGKRSSWVRLEGEKEGQPIGIAIYHHPESVNYPTYWHARGYGCFSANPIGQYDFQRGRGEENPQRRTLSINPGESALFKFRMTIYEGAKTKDYFDNAFKSFSE